MANLGANIANLRNQVSEIYDKLSASEQLIVQLLSVIYEPISRASLLLCLSHFEAQDDKGKPFTNPSLNTSIERLLKVGVLTQSSGAGPQCHSLLTEIATRDAVKTGQFPKMVEAVHKVLPAPTRFKNRPGYFRSIRQFMREVRIAIYQHDVQATTQILKDFDQSSFFRDQMDFDDILVGIVNNPFDAEWFRTLPPVLYEDALVSILNTSMLELLPATEAFELLEADAAHPEQVSDGLLLILLEQYVLRGNVSAAQALMERIPTERQPEIKHWQGWLAFLQGDNDHAIALYTEALQLFKKKSNKRKYYFSSMSGLFFILALLKDGTPARLAEAEGYSAIARQAKNWLSDTYAFVEKVLQIQAGDLTKKESILANPALALSLDHSIEALFCALCLYWVDRNTATAFIPKRLKSTYQEAEAAGYAWLAMELGELLTRANPRGSQAKQVQAWRKSIPSVPLIDIIQPKETWELCLSALANLRQTPQAATKPESNQRLVWFITYYAGNGQCVLQPREQSLTAKGGWSKGRNIALKRLRDTSELSYLTPQDLRVCSQIQTYNQSYYGQVDYRFSERAIASLIGHPLVFWEDAPTTRVEIVKGEPELLVKKVKNEFLTLQFSPAIKPDQSVITVKESPTRLRVIEITEEHRRIAEILGKQNRLEVPESAKERVLTAIGAVSGIVTVHSDIGGGVESAEEVPADPKPHVHLLPANAGLKVAVLARPFGNGGPYYRPGTGGETVIAEIAGKRLQTTRSLKEEKKLANAAIAACHTLAEQDSKEKEWLIDDPEMCLEFLLELQALGDEVTVEWPEGEKLRVKQQVGLNNFQMRIQQQRDWFSANGELKLNDDLVLDMQRLMELLDQTSGRFLPLGDGQFLALTQEFRKRLEELRAYSEKHAKGFRFHPLAAIALDEWVDEVGQLKTDKHWKAHIERLKEAQTLEPELPSTLQAELRDYQIDGFKWLARLAHWGVGACLADDMGLGKTLQALAMILTRAPEGPTLVVAPTSVCMNWMSEAARFAPTLNVIQFGTGDRQKLLDNLQPLDMLVCSYGLLQQEELAEKLAQVKWQTIVLDEAQSIKNFATKRSQAAMNLQGGFKILTTGTPIENHLGELWNLFRFINPGLLGSLEQFNQKFANPIERYGDRAARNQLKKLIQPFILRRTKNQVLSELPSRTEILLQVDLSSEEMAFYEALRQQAITKLLESDANAGQRHLQVLAEIMKLRRACCNPHLVKPELALPSSKLQLFGEVLAELLENRHKALVFSQFVDHLHLIQAYLDEKKITYQYLDGSTPANERKKRVDAFQSGQGDVFLISLKAGGTGLNLTAADYVIHMDPWWNPAVEDQASDRAHRIGQQRPVTIYRLVAKNTIEEKIVDLHQHKRDLADSLLEGTDMSGKISTDELLRLISES